MEKSPHNFPSGLKALVADDHDLIRKSIAKALVRLGFSEVLECHNGRDAKIILDTQAVDLVICDLDLNFISGFEVLDHLRSLDTGSDTPFMIVTGAADKDDIVKAANKGAEEYMVKPFTPEELEAKIIKMLNQYHAPGPILGRLREAEKLLVASQFAEAETVLDELVKIKDSPRARHLQAVALVKQRKTAEAIALLQANIKSTPNFLKNFVTLANLYIEAKDFKNAIHALTMELELNPKQPLRQIKLANMLLKEGNSHAAIEHYRLALLENNKNPEALYGMGMAYALAENLEKSIYYFKRYRRNHPKDSRPLKAIVQFAEKTQQLRIAEVALVDERKAHPERLDTYLILAEFYFKHEKEEQAYQTLEAAIKRKPEFTQAHVAMAQYYLQQNDSESAIRVYQRYINITKDPVGYMLQAQLYLQLKKYAQAMATLHHGIDSGIDPQKAFPLLMISTFRTKQIGKTWYIRERMKQLNPNEEIPAPIAEIDQLLLARRRVKRGFQKVS
ncbi:response regulator [Oligoflexus tunisiensis]|uniref:response regulator n=1 Tax=Oligoflexus tunisiensis TaxID=708132 RepID=UPI00114C9E67|nr:response regulator [Oligoflexus tunisiensis]